MGSNGKDWNASAERRRKRAANHNYSAAAVADYMKAMIRADVVDGKHVFDWLATMHDTANAVAKDSLPSTADPDPIADPVESLPDSGIGRIGGNSAKAYKGGEQLNADGTPNPDYIDWLIETDPQVFRFMNLLRVNDSEAERWEDFGSDGQFGKKGVPLATCAEITRACDFDPWYCVPHKFNKNATREYLLRLDADTPDGRTIYIEGGNEFWNGQFDQFDYAIEEARREGTLDQSGRRPGDPKWNKWYAAMNWHAVRTAAIAGIAEAIDPDRFHVTLGTQWGRPDYTRSMLAHLKSTGRRMPDSVCHAPYMGGKLWDRLDLIGKPEAVITACRAHWANEVKKKTAEHRAHCDAHGVDLIMYEGGQHLAVGPWWGYMTEDQIEQWKRKKDWAEEAKTAEPSMAHTAAVDVAEFERIHKPPAEERRQQMANTFAVANTLESMGDLYRDYWKWAREAHNLAMVYRWSPFGSGDDIKGGTESDPDYYEHGAWAICNGIGDMSPKLRAVLDVRAMK